MRKRKTQKSHPNLFNYSDRNRLLEELHAHQEEQKNLDTRNLLMVFGILLIALMLFVPKIYIRNHIYFASRDIERLQIQQDILQEENKKLRQQLEDIKFKNLVMEMAY